MQTHRHYLCPHTGLTQWCLAFIPLILIHQKNLFYFNAGQICGSQNLGCTPQPSLLFSQQLQFFKKKSLFALLRAKPQSHALKDLMLASGIGHNRLHCFSLGIAGPKTRAFHCLFQRPYEILYLSDI